MHKVVHRHIILQMAGQIWAKSGSDWPQMGYIWHFFLDQISVYHFVSKTQDVLKYHLKKSRICPI